MLYHPVTKKIVHRPELRTTHLNLKNPLLGQILSKRGVESDDRLDYSLKQLPAPTLLSGMDVATDILYEAIHNRSKTIVIADYDADGATACAVAVKGLQMLGLENISYLVPNRFEFGYGLTPDIVKVASLERPDLLITVDNGISSLDGVETANALGIKVIVTDHHLPGLELPNAHAIVNPNLSGDPFPSKALAGVGVMFYVLLGLRQKLRSKGYFLSAQLKEPNLGDFLDLVALGTIADLVELDHTNRILVQQGLERIRAGRACPGIMALLTVAERPFQNVQANDLGYSVGPRLNAAGRLEDMTLGIECLLSLVPENSNAMAAQLNAINLERRVIEDTMKAQALSHLGALTHTDQSKPAVCLFDATWHQGVVGLIASRLKDRLHRPVIAFAPSDQEDSILKGSARSIPGIHIRDVLADVATKYPELILKFGGHSMAAGLSIARNGLDDFKRAFQQAVSERTKGLDLQNTVLSDAKLEPNDMTLENAECLQTNGPWGQGFPEPLFDGDFRVISVRIVGHRHLKWLLKPLNSEDTFDAIAFGIETPEKWLRARSLRAAYRLDVNEYRGSRSLQLRIEYMEAPEPQATQFNRT